MRAYERTYGVEIECISPVGTSRPQMARLLTEAGVPAYDAGYSHTISHQWKICSDNSLTEGRRGPGMEFVSPPLSGEEGFATIAKVCDILRQKGFDVDKSCGLHVHVDVRRPTALDISALRRLAMLYADSESILDTVMPPTRRGNANMYARSLQHANVMENLSTAADATAIARILYGERVNRFGEAQRRRAHHTSMHHLKFVKLNFVTTWTYGTVEFRHHAGTIDATKICQWSLVCLRMVDYANHAVTTEEILDSSRRVFSTVRRGTKRAVIYDMLLRAEGVTLQEVLAATGWRQASVANIAHQYGMSLRQERVRVPTDAGLVMSTRYWGTLTGESQVPTRRRAGGTVLPGPKPTNLDEFADKIGMSMVEKEFWHQRAALLAQPTVNLMTPEAIVAAQRR